MTSDPALDLLWTNLTRPSQIVHLLPDEVYELTKSRQYNLKRALVESDFTVFDKYASRVKFVDFSSYFTSITGGCELLSTLKSFRDPIFPRLLGFDWHPTAKFNTVGAFHLISLSKPRMRQSPNLQTLQVGLVWPKQSFCFTSPSRLGSPTFPV
ncbi:hypothetical protein B0H17DRAFT_325096 [Mycena rosella]|uniref:Uncharacterized protein n=1 Tax=Mycena rosella TaxID=1033263 RepID=A0AAD7DV14_MYCRO|nr:hypothetical protein B0H17DRAFT_325096 [Mycena rosella]